MISRCLFGTDRPEIAAIAPWHLAATFPDCQHQAFQRRKNYFLEVDFASLDVAAIAQFIQAADVDWLDTWEVQNAE